MSTSLAATPARLITLVPAGPVRPTWTRACGAELALAVLSNAVSIGWDRAGSLSVRIAVTTGNTTSRPAGPSQPVWTRASVAARSVLIRPGTIRASSTDPGASSGTAATCS